MTRSRPARPPASSARAPRPTRATSAKGSPPPAPPGRGGKSKAGPATTAPRKPASSGGPRRAPPPRKPGPGATIVKHEAGMTLVRFVVLEAGGDLSGREAKRLLDAGRCSINGRVETFGSRVLEAGDAVELALPPKKTARTRAAFERERVIFEDEFLLIYDKPPNLQVVPGDGRRGPNLAELVQAAVPTAEPVHRIDADTSGLVIFAKNPQTRAALEEAFKEHAVHKRYLALVCGQPRAEGIHKSYFVKVAAGRGFERWESGHGAGAKEAITKWRLVEKVGFWGALVEVFPETGRHHQIRIHMAELGHPLLGDTRYGDRKDPIPTARHMLHASEIEFTHPDTGRRLQVKAHLPEDFRAAIDALRKSS